MAWSDVSIDDLMDDKDLGVATPAPAAQEKNRQALTPEELDVLFGKTGKMLGNRGVPKYQQDLMNLYHSHVRPHGSAIWDGTAKADTGVMRQVTVERDVAKDVDILKIDGMRYYSEEGCGEKLKHLMDEWARLLKRVEELEAINKGLEEAVRLLGDKGHNTATGE